MALSAATFTSSCVPQTQSRSLCVPKSHLVSSSTSLSPPQATQKFLYQPLKYKRVISPIGVNPKRSFGPVKAVKDVEVFSRERLDVSLAHDIAELSKKFIAERGSFSVALSDSVSLKHLRKLVEPPYINDVAWSKWQFFWVEEELFAKTNHRPAYDEFLTMVSKIGDLNVNTVDYDLSTRELAVRYVQKLQTCVNENKIAKSTRNELPKFDLMLLGMDPYGRVGSLAPEDAILDEKERWVASVKEKDATRVTLTLPVINSCSYIAMVVAGSAKADAVYSALTVNDDPLAARKFPAKMISPDEGEVVWYLDKGAASKLFKQEVEIGIN